MFDAIRAGITVRGLFDPPSGIASMQLEVRMSSDSEPNAIKVIEAMFPRMPVVDAVPRPDNPPAKLPMFALQDDSTRRFDIMLRFVNS